MSVSADDVSRAFAKEAGRELDAARAKIEHCLNQLTEEQLWWRPSESMNSVANLILHLCGNLRQWIISGVGGAADIRDRPKEFSRRGHVSRTDLFQQLDDTVAQALGVLSRVTVSGLVDVRRIQGFDVTGLEAIIGSIAHFRGHCQEIVHLTRLQLGDSYEFDFVPATPEQGAP